MAILMAMMTSCIFMRDTVSIIVAMIVIRLVTSALTLSSDSDSSIHG